MAKPIIAAKPITTKDVKAGAVSLSPIHIYIERERKREIRARTHTHTHLPKHVVDCFSTEKELFKKAGLTLLQGQLNDQ